MPAPISRRYHSELRVKLYLIPVLVLASITLLVPDPTLAQGNSPIIRIEEDWILQVGNPDAANVAPQITNVISPSQDLNGFHAILELNHSTAPDFEAGGIQLQLWNSEERLSYKSYAGNLKLQANNESITYTVVMEIAGDALNVSVKNGVSATWGQFGQQQNLLVTTPAMSIQNLDNYDPQVSVTRSAIGYAGNRVVKYAISTIRYYDSNGLVNTDSTEKIVHSQSP